MKKRTMKVVSLILAIVMVVAMLPLSALAGATPVRQVGVVVYGAELTSILTAKEEGVTASLENLLRLAQSVIANGKMEVPEVDIKVTDSNNKTHKMVPKQVNLIRDTANKKLPCQEVMDELQENIQIQLEAVENLLKVRPAGATIVDKANEMKDAMNSSLSGAQEAIDKLQDTLLEYIALNPTLYRSYVTEEKLPAGTATVYVNGFADRTEDNNLVTRDGYVLYNDGNGMKETGYTATRKFTIEVKEQGKHETEIQFVGPKNGLEGKLVLLDVLKGPYEATKTMVNTSSEFLKSAREEIDKEVQNFLKTAEAVKNIVTDPISFIASILRGDTLDYDKLKADSELYQLVIKTFPEYELIMNWPLPTMKANFDTSYELTFPGLWCAESDAGFSFRNSDVAGTPISVADPDNAAAFAMINRDEVVDILDFMIGLGKETFTQLMNAAFNETTFNGVTYDSLVKLHTQLINTDGQTMALNLDTAKNIVMVYVGVISNIDIFEKVKEANLHIPAILLATADENGIVTFNKDSNKTLTWMLAIIPTILKSYNNLNLNNKFTDAILDVLDYKEKLENTKFRGIVDDTIDAWEGATEDLVDTGVGLLEGTINTLVYPFAQRLGLVGPKMGSGYYVMFQYRAPEGYVINPFAYTMKVTWENDRWVYTTVANLGILTPYFAEGFYDFVRGTSFENSLVAVLGKLNLTTVSEYVSKVFNSDIKYDELKNDAQKTTLAALNAFIAKAGFQAFDLDSIYANTPDFITAMNTYLLENSNSARNILLYLNNQAKKAKTVYTGIIEPTYEIDEDGKVITRDETWDFYNIDDSPTLTATKLINKSTQAFVAAIGSNSKHTATQSAAVQKVGDAVSRVVTNVGTKIEQQKTIIKAKVKEAAKSVLSKVAQSLTSVAKSAFSNLITNIGKLFNRSLITFEA